MRRSSRSSDIVLFDAFAKALRELSERDKLLFGMKRNKISLSHRLANYLEKNLREGTYVDISYSVGSCTPDLIAHDRNGRIQLAIWWQDEYLTRKLQDEAKRFHEEYGCFTLAFSLLSDRDYFLIYRFASTYTDYLHISREDFSESLLKRMKEEENTFDGQLLLDIPKKRSRKRKASLPAQNAAEETIRDE